MKLLYDVDGSNDAVDESCGEVNETSDDEGDIMEIFVFIVITVIPSFLLPSFTTSPPSTAFSVAKDEDEVSMSGNWLEEDGHGGNERL